MSSVNGRNLVTAHELPEIALLHRRSDRGLQRAMPSNIDRCHIVQIISLRSAWSSIFGALVETTPSQHISPHKRIRDMSHQEMK